MIKVGFFYNLDIHGIIREIIKNPARGIKYYLINKNKSHFKDYFDYLFIDEDKKYQFYETLDVPIFTQKNWIFNLAAYNPAISILNTYLPRDSRIKLYNKILSKPNCKKLLFFSKAGMESMYEYGEVKDKEIINKSQILAPAVGKIENKHRSGSNTLNILFVGYNFHQKGGLHVLRAFDKLTKRFDNLRLHIFSHLSRKDYKDYSNFLLLHNFETIKLLRNKHIYSYESINREKLFKEFYSNADIFLMPTMQETYGYALVEAMAHGLPILSTNHFAIPEIVQHSKNGFLIDIEDKPFIKHSWRYQNNNGKYLMPKCFDKFFTNEVHKYLKELVENASLRKKMGNKSLEIARTKFSFKKRNKTIKQIFEDV